MLERQDLMKPTVVEEQVLKSTTETDSMLLKIDNVIAPSKSITPPRPSPGVDTVIVMIASRIHYT
jgi:chaperonin GroEL (HSP60 family)